MIFWPSISTAWFDRFFGHQQDRYRTFLSLDDQVRHFLAIDDAGLCIGNQTCIVIHVRNRRRYNTRQFAVTDGLYP